MKINELKVPFAISPEPVVSEINKCYPDYFKTTNFSDELAIICDFREPVKPHNLLGLSFIITDLQSLEPFRQLRLQVKEKYGLGNQEIKYSKFRSKKKRPAYVNSFINIADEIEGLMCNFIIAPTLDELIPHFYSKFIDKYPAYEVFNNKVFRKLNFVAHLISVLLLPILTNNTKLYFISDQDDMFVNSKIRDLSLAYIIQTIEAYSLKESFQLAFLDPKQDSDDRYLRDLSSIPDLAVGSLTDLFNSFDGNYENLRKGRQLFPKNVKNKAHSYSEWLFSKNKPLKRESFFMELHEENEIRYYPLTPI